MSAPGAGGRRFDVLTFDCYGTLVDWEQGIAEAFAATARADGVALEREAVLAAYHEAEPALQADRYRPYREILALTARAVAGRLGWRLAPGRERFLPESLPSWPPFPDTNDALRRMADAGHRLAILSNVDDDLLAGTLRHLKVAVDFVITAQQVGAYKPAPAHFEAARARIGTAPWLHVAQSYFHDVQPCRRLGIPVAWINRKAERPLDDRGPDHEFRTLAEAAAWLAGEASS
jgi:2-haloacid dehalogenase/putative hydrolase of the HAD superfamily